MIPKENICKIIDYSVIHGRDLCWSLMNFEQDKLASAKFNFDNIFVCTVIDNYSVKS